MNPISWSAIHEARRSCFDHFALYGFKRPDSDPDFKQTRLKLSSVIKADKLFTIHKGLIIGKVAELMPRMMQNVDAALRLALGL